MPHQILDATEGRPVSARIEDYAIIGDTRTVGLVDGSGSIDWWCAPRIDSGAAFAALLGTKDNGRWLMAPKDHVTAVSRRYEPETLVLETVFETSTGRVAVTDFMPPQHGDPTIHRIVEGREGTVDMGMELIVRFEYGSVTPWVTATMAPCGANCPRGATNEVLVRSRLRRLSGGGCGEERGERERAENGTLHRGLSTSCSRENSRSS